MTPFPVNSPELASSLCCLHCFVSWRIHLACDILGFPSFSLFYMIYIIKNNIYILCKIMYIYNINSISISISL